MKCRKNVKSLSVQEKTNFINAFLALKAEDSILHPGTQSRYDDFVEVHLNAMYDFNTNNMRPLSWAHGGSIFLPWHREMIYQFEMLLQTVDSSVMIPYWDWTRAQNPGDSGYPFAHNFLAEDGTDSDSDRVKKEVGAPSPYPYDFDPEDWSSSIGVTDPGDFLTYFQRAFGERADAPGLPDNDSNVVGTGTNFRAAIDGGNNYTTLRARCEDLHNLVHRYVNGNMLRMTSPNDPIFFLHHATIDRMWSIWQEKVPNGTPLYVQSSNVLGHKLNDAMLFNENGATAPFIVGATPAQVINGHTMHGSGVWYDTDIPEIDTPDPTLDFLDIPEGLTSYKAVKFRIKGCRQVRFRITGNPTGNFGLTTMGTEFIANSIDSDDFFYGFVWVKLDAVAGPIPNSSVNIEAYLLDAEGYYAATEGGEYHIANYSVTLTATTIARSSNSIALVLDRSGSMSAPAGGTSTRSILVQSAIDVFKDLMLPNDEVSVVTFDTIIETPVPIQLVSGTPDFATIDISPRGATWIGGGIEEGAVQLAAAGHPNKSTIVLTDGNENIHPFISELPAGTVTTKTYAIGFGLPGQVSDAALQEITGNTNGDLIITGNITSEEQRFHLTKYFVQILAGVTSSQIILDPGGKLFFGSKDVIPFHLSDADIFVDAILLCPLPKFLEFVLETPSGEIIKPSTTALNIIYKEGRQVAFYRMTLPAISNDPSGSHGGTWKAIIALKSAEEIKRLMRDEKFANTEVQPKISEFMPYSFIVHATSNIKFEASISQSSFKPGSKIEVKAALKEYDVPLANSVNIWVELTDPAGQVTNLKLDEKGPGEYNTSFNAKDVGIYKCRVRAEGASSTGSKFHREKTLTASSFYSRQSDYPTNKEDRLCQLILCMLSKDGKPDGSWIKKLEEFGFDRELIEECFKKIMSSYKKELIPSIHNKITQSILKKPQLVRQIKLKKINKAKEIKQLKKLQTKSIKDVKQKEEFKTMFMPLDLEKEEKLGAKTSSAKKKKK